MSKLETNTIDTVSGTTNLVVGSTNSSTVTFENGSPTGHMYPAFHAELSATQEPSNDTATVVQFNRETLDTDNAYDNSSNYRFTPQVAGKYFVYSQILNNPSSSNNIQQARINIRKNGSNVSNYQFSSSTNPVDEIGVGSQVIVDLNGSSDYVDVIGTQAVSSGTNRFSGGTTSDTYFGAYRIGA